MGAVVNLTGCDSQHHGNKNSGSKIDTFEHGRQVSSAEDKLFMHCYGIKKARIAKSSPRFSGEIFLLHRAYTSRSRNAFMD